MSPLGQFPNFLTDGSRIRRPPIDDTKNPIFRLARRTSKNFQYPASGRSPGSVFPALFSFIRACAAFLSRFRHFCPDIYLIANYYYLFPFQHPLSRQSSAIFCRQFSVQVFKKSSPFFSMFSTSPSCQLPCSLICLLFPVQRFSPPGAFAVFLPASSGCIAVHKHFYSSPAPRSGLPSRFSPASDETVSLSTPSPPFPHNPKFCHYRIRHRKWFYPA